MGGSFFLNSLGSVAGGRGNGGKEQTAAHQHKEEQTTKAIHGDSVFHKVRQAAVQAAFPEERARRDIRMLPNRKTSGDDFAFTCILKYIQGQHMSGKPFTANQGQGSLRISMKCAMGDNTMNISILEGYPFCAELPAEHPCSSVCLRGGGILSGAFLHIGTASLDDKGAPCGYCTDESAWRTACLMHTPRTCL